MCFGDLHTIMQIISHHEIKKIIEFGTYTLGTAHLLSDAFPEVKIISVDINDPGEDCKKAWKEFVPQPNIEFILGDINKIGENLILKERPDMLIIDYEHRAQSTLHFVDFAIQQGVKAIIIHDVNDVTSECNFGDVAAAMHIISTYDDKYQILKTPYQQGILALINPHTNDTNKLHEYSGNLSIRDIRVSKSDAVVSACVTADRGKYTNYYLSYNQPSWVTLNIVKPTPDGRYELKLFDNSTKELLGNNQVDANRGNIYHFCSVTGHPWYTEYLSRVYHNGILDYEEILDLRGKNVFIEQLHAALGDTICLVPLIFEFQKKHQCKVEVLLGHGFIPGFPELYDDTEHVKFVRQPSGYFIKYQLLIEAKRKSQLIKLGEGMTDVLGIEYQDCIYDLTAKAGEPTIPKPYVCIAPTCVRPDKQWHWQGGMTEAWQQVVDFLRDLGYQVVVISLEQFPLKHVIDKTGNLSLLDRVNDLTHAEFFIGLSSGLSWLAHNCKKFVFMLIGPIASWHEFETNVHKIYNHECDCLSCANNPEIPWNYGNCPLPEKNYECTRYLEPGQVITEIEQKIRNGIQYDEWRIVTPLQNRTVLDSEFPKVGFCNGGKGGSNGVNESIFDKSTKSIS
jgi:autotransporter strand-loop-strand O-heptosyltransferase